MAVRPICTVIVYHCHPEWLKLKTVMFSVQMESSSDETVVHRTLLAATVFQVPSSLCRFLFVGMWVCACVGGGVGGSERGGERAREREREAVSGSLRLARRGSRWWRRS